MRPFSGTAQWIWLQQETGALHADSVAVCAVFVRTFDAAPGARLVVHVSADSAYRLRVNGTLAASGPVRGDPAHWFYDTVDVSLLLKAGRNELHAEVVSFAGAWPDYQRGGPPVSIMAQTPGFILDGTLLASDGVPLESLSTDARWRGAQADGVYFVRCQGVPCAGPGEISPASAPWPTMQQAQPVRERAAGVTATTVTDSLLPHRLMPQMIPPLLDVAEDFAGNGVATHLPAGETADMLLDAGAITTGYPLVEVDGTGTVTLHYAERLLCNGLPVRDAAHPHDPLTGPLRDVVQVTGSNHCWRPFFWRAFRFIRVVAAAGAEPLRLHIRGYRRVHYPYPESGYFSSDNPAHTVMESISRRTLQLCSHDTFEDCPYFERLQYAGDVHIQARSAYWMTGDTRLAAQALRQFAWSLQAEGLTASRYPSRVPQFIPLWSLHWILAVGEYTAYSGDATVAQTCLPAMNRVLQWFWEHRQQDGLIGALPGWMVADWSPDWPGGIPPGADRGPSAMIQFMAIAAARAVDALADTGWAPAADALQRVADAAFWDAARGCYRDRPEPGGEASRLTNAWAILAGVPNEARSATIAHTLATAPDLCREAWFGRNFVFDAFMATGRHADAEHVLEPFMALIQQGFTTWPEDIEAARSECHGWSNLPGVAMRQLYLGVRLAEPGCGRVIIQPWCGALQEAKGTVPLPQGILRIGWQRHGNQLRVNFDAPADVEVEVRTLPGGPECVISLNGNWLSK